MAKNPWLAAILSLVISGLGQFYNREYGKGFLFLAVEFVTGYGYYELNSVAAGVGNVAVNLYSIWDAYYSARKTDRPPETGLISEEDPMVRVY